MAEKIAKGPPAVHEDYQGLRDFTNVDEYVDKWVTPYVLRDLDTVFEGAQKYWYDVKGFKDGNPGRGDFILAGGLFWLIDHLGSFLAPSSTDWLGPSENVSRLARYLPSTRDIPIAIAQLGRHPIVHGGWPQTTVPMTNNSWSTYNGTATWAFGLSFTADRDTTHHDMLYTLPWRKADTSLVQVTDGAKLLKLVLNINVLCAEVVSFIQSEEFRRRAKQGFSRARKVGELNGNPFMGEELKRTTTPRSRDTGIIKAMIDSGKTEGDARRELAALYRERLQHGLCNEILSLRVEAERVQVEGSCSWEIFKHKCRRDHNLPANKEAVKRLK